MVISVEIDFRLIKNNIIILLFGIVLGFAALFVVHCIPVDQMAQHVWQSLPMIESEFFNSDMIMDYPGTFMGSFTDCLMLENSIYENKAHSTLEQTLMMYRGESGTGEGWATGYSLSDYLNGVLQLREESYARYWHGYLVILKPLLYFMNFNSIRMIQAALQLILAGLVIMAFSKRGEFFLGTAFLFSLPFMYYFSLFSSLSLSICFYIMAAFVLALLIWYDKLAKGKHLCEFFLVIGMCTSYFDFLTYPIVTLIFPLCVVLWIGSASLKSSFKNIICLSLEWGMGYVLFWASKWLITDVLTHNGIIRDALMTVSERTASADGGGTGLFEVILENIGMYFNWGFYIVAALIVLWIIIEAISVRGKSGCSWQRALPFVTVGLYPFIWFVFTQNHSHEHAIFTCKILAGSVFAFICAAGSFLKEEG